MATKTTPPQVEVSQPEIVHHLKLNATWERFDESVQAAARAGKIRNAEPLLRSLNVDIRVFNGLAVLIEIVRNNAMLQDQFDPADANSVKPLDENATDALLSLASEICHARSSEICGLADWVEKHIASEVK
jgi:hypothetical protein